MNHPPSDIPPDPPSDESPAGDAVGPTSSKDSRAGNAPAYGSPFGAMQPPGAMQPLPGDDSVNAAAALSRRSDADGAGPPRTPSVNPLKMSRRSFDQYRRYKRRQLRTSILLFLATLVSTFLVGSQFIPLQLAPAWFLPEYRAGLEQQLAAHAAAVGKLPSTIEDIMWQSSLSGAQYAIPLMLILLCHEMGHFLQSVRYRVPASFPYFIPLPLPPLGTMGAVILQGRGVANRRQMFDIAVSGPIAGLIVTLPVLYYGIRTSRYETLNGAITSMEFGEPLLVTWMIEWLHHPAQEGQVFVLNGYGFAGWVGVFITAMNLLPIGQLDGGHILYTLIGKPAHWVAMLVIGLGIALMFYTGSYSYILLVVLLLLTGARHPPTADDSVPLGKLRQCVGWATLAFLIIGFTPQPIIIQDQTDRPVPEEHQRRVDPSEVDPNMLV